MEKNKDFPNFWQAILVLAIMFGLQILIVSIMYDAGTEITPGNPGVAAIISIFSCGILFSALMAYKNIGYKELFSPAQPVELVTLKKFAIPVMLVCCGLSVLFSDLDKLIVYYFPMNSSHIEMFNHLTGGGFFSFFYVCLLAPVIEEMLFRGIILRAFLHKYNSINAILLSSLLFGAIHLNIYQLVDAFILGIFFGWLYVSTQSLWPCIFAHMTCNIVSMIYLGLYGNYENAVSPDNISFQSPILTLAAALLVYSGVKKIRKLAQC